MHRLKTIFLVVCAIFGIVTCAVLLYLMNESAALAAAHAADETNLRQIARAERIAKLAAELPRTLSDERRGYIAADLRAEGAALGDAHRELTRPSDGSPPPSRMNPDIALIYHHPERGADISVRGVLYAISAPSAPMAAVGPGLEAEAAALADRLRAADDALSAETSTRRRRLENAWLAALIGLPGLAFGLSAFALHPALRRQEARMQRLEDCKLRAEHGALHDGLTGLPNRRYLSEHLTRVLADARRGGRTVAALHIGLNRMKAVNDMLGHSAGDKMLRHAARLLRGHIGAGDFVARVGGDEFVIIMQEPGSRERLIGVADRFVELLSEPISINGRQARISASVGIAASGPDADGATNAERLLMNSDLALHDAKTGRRGRVKIFSTGRREAFEDRQRTIDELRAALSRDEIEPWFQPQVCARSGRLTGFESLVRWRHPSRGVLTPGHFLDAASDSGLIDGIEEVVVRKSLAALSEWRRRGLEVGRIGLNVSALELRDARFVDKLAWDVDAAGLEPENVAIEILESVLIDDDEDPVIRNIAALASAGFSIDLDDFGTGHASISNLQKFRVHRIKIDRSFVAGVDADPSRRKIAAAMINLAHSLDIEALAEGVETPAERRELEALGCDHIQGFGLGRPMPFADALSWLEARRGAARAAARA